MPLTHLTFQFDSEPQSLSLQPAALPLHFYLSIHLFTVLIQGYHFSNIYHPFLLLALSVHRPFVSPFPPLVKHSSGEFQSPLAHGTESYLPSILIV